MTALDAEFPCEESDGIARMEQVLDSHMPCPWKLFLEEEVRVPEVRKRNAASGLKRRREFRRSVNPRHPDPAATGCRLEQHRIADFRRDDSRLVERPERLIHAAGDRHSFTEHRLSSSTIVAR